MAVRSSVADEIEDQGVLVTFRAPEITVAGMLPEKLAALRDNRLLGRGETEITEELCADKHCTSKAQGMKTEGME
jgi:hypothetical protein